MSLPKADEWNDPGPMDGAWKPKRFGWLRVVLPIIAVVGSLFIWRATTLFGLPDIGEPFDLEAKGNVDIPENENAFTFYRVAAAKLVGRRSGGRYAMWASVNEDDREWFRNNNEALRIWMAGTTMERAVFVQPRDQSPDRGTVQNMRSLAVLAQIAGLRMEAVGDFEEAWTMYRAVLRSSRHCAMHGSFIERLIAVAIFNSVSSNIYAWSDQPNLDAELLRKALADLLALEAMTPSLRENYEAEYFEFHKLLDDPHVTSWRIRELVEGVVPKTIAPRDRIEEAFSRIVKREPERSRRVLRVLWANLLAASDLPWAERLKHRHVYAGIYLFDPPADAPASARRLTPAQLADWIDSTRLLKLVTPATSALENSIAKEIATRADLIIHVAEQLYLREHKKPVAKPEDLVPEYLKALPEGYVPAGTK